MIRKKTVATVEPPKIPTIVVQLTNDEGLKVELVNWQHNAPVRLLAALDLQVQRAIHSWRGKFLRESSEFNTPNLRQRDAAEEADQRRAT